MTSVATISRAVRLGGDDRQCPDRTAAGDEDALSDQRSRAGDGVKGDGKWLGHRCLVDRHTVGDLVALPVLGDQALAERALNMRHHHGAAIEAHVQALVLLPDEAIGAGIARAAR